LRKEQTENVKHLFACVKNSSVGLKLLYDH